MILTTTSGLQGKEIVEYYGIVSGEAILGANIIRDFFAGVRDIVGGRAGAYEKSLKEAKEIAMIEMIEEAKLLGANAIIGVDLDYETINEGMLMVAAAGTTIKYQ